MTDIDIDIVLLNLTLIDQAPIRAFVVQNDYVLYTIGRPRVSLARFTFFFWCHNRLLMMSQWPDNCDAITWIVIFNSLDIEFIQGDIHGQSCEIDECLM